MSGLLGKKIGMTRIFKGNESVPVTVIQAGPCIVCQKKVAETDGYNAIQIGFEQKKEKSTTNPMKGHFKKANVKPMRYLREIRVENPDDYQIGQELNLSLFELGQKNRRHRRYERPRLYGRYEKMEFPRRRDIPRIEVPPGTGEHRPAHLSRTNLSRQKDARPIWK